MIGFVLLNLSVIFTSIIILKKIFRGGSFSDKICLFFVFFFAQIVFTETVLGIFRALFLGNLILLNAFILFLVWLALKSRKTGKVAALNSSSFSWIIENKTVLFCLSVLLGFLAFKTLFNLINPSFGWDSLNYHFTFPVEWIKNGNLNNPPTICDDPTPTYYPIGGCLYYLWLIIPFKNAFIADIGQVPFLILSFFACFSIGRKAGLTRELSFYAAGIFVIIPNFFKQIEVGYADIIMVAFFLVTLNLLFILNKDFSLKNLIASGISLGLFLSIKTLSLAYSLALGAFALWILIKRARGMKFAGYGFAFLSLAAIFGGYAYLKNFFLTGNPLFPLDFKFLGLTVFRGVMPKSTYLVRWNHEGYNLIKLFFHEGMGLQLLFLIFPAMFIALPVTLFKKRGQKKDFDLIYLLALPLGLYFIFIFVIPQLWTRFLYPFLGVGAVVAVYTLNILKIPLKIIRGVVIICFLGSIMELSSYAELAFSLITTVLLFFYMPYFFKFLKRGKIRPALLFVMLIVFACGFKAGERWYLSNEYDRYIKYAPYWEGAMQAWKWLNENTSNNRIAYTGRPVPFPLYGTNFKNDVYYVSVNDIHPAQLHFFPQGNLDWNDYEYDKIDRVLRRDENYRGRARFNQWYKNLVAEKTDYLFVYLLDEENYAPIEDKWAGHFSDKFTLLFGNSEAHIYKVIK